MGHADRPRTGISPESLDASAARKRHLSAVDRSADHPHQDDGRSASALERSRPYSRRADERRPSVLRDIQQHKAGPLLIVLAGASHEQAARAGPAERDLYQRTASDLQEISAMRLGGGAVKSAGKRRAVRQRSQPRARVPAEPVCESGGQRLSVSSRTATAVLVGEVDRQLPPRIRRAPVGDSSYANDADLEIALSRNEESTLFAIAYGCSAGRFRGSVTGLHQMRSPRRRGRGAAF